MGSRASTLLRDEELEEIKKETGFSHSQITRLYSRFTSLDKGENGTLSREDFQRIPELAINPLGDRIINAFFPEGEDQVNFRGFMRTLAHFRPIEDNEKSKDVNGPEPLNSRSNKLHCEDLSCLPRRLPLRGGPEWDPSSRWRRGAANLSDPRLQHPPSHSLSPSLRQSVVFTERFLCGQSSGKGDDSTDGADPFPAQEELQISRGEGQERNAVGRIRSAARGQFQMQGGWRRERESEKRGLRPGRLPEGPVHPFGALFESHLLQEQRGLRDREWAWR
uniref:EF-hand domain-containing protein n=1 Tax=Ornithorhynchus anatinus TaxID=9258 RepID=A0A6I8NEF8_ORNAN